MVQTMVDLGQTREVARQPWFEGAMEKIVAIMKSCRGEEIARVSAGDTASAHQM